MAVAFRAKTHAIGTLTATEPAATANGDTIIALLYVFGETTVHGGPASWAQVGSQLNDGIGGRASVWRIARGGSAPSLVWTGPAGSSVSDLTLLTYIGAATSGTIIDAFTMNTATGVASANSPSVSATILGDMLICFLVDVDGQMISDTKPTGMTARQDTTGSTETLVADLLLGATGATGTKSWAFVQSGAPSAQNLIAGSILLAPPGATGTSDIQAPGRVQRQLINHWRRQ